MLKDKIEKLCFWDKIQTGDIVPVATRRKEYIATNRKFNPKFRITDEQTSEEIELGKQFDALEAKRTPRAFPTTDSVYHFHPIALIEHLKMIVRKEDIDLADSNKWISQFTQPRPKEACYRTSVLVVKNYGAKSGGLGNKLSSKYENGTSKYSNVIQPVVQMSDGTLKDTNEKKAAIDYIDDQLERGYPIVVGVDREVYKTYNTDNTTDYFIVIVGRKTDKIGLYYRFYEVGTYPENKETKGINPNNRLYVKEDNRLVGRKPMSNKNYTLTQVRKNI